ncbi:DNA polymerase Y family protein [Hydrogenophaga sp. OTU3427]|uniref:DNA polymerase Y family protein n=1 Tax=Hydrogenophaga sp. OTU3427 TaxID=3043856 RepID=UPI00313AD6B9
MWWIALLPRCAAPPAPSPSEAALALAWWSLQWTPRVCLLDEAVLLEVLASERLFGGRRVLLQRLRVQAATAGASAMATAPTALAALALLRQFDAETDLPTGGAPTLRATGCGARRLRATLDALPLAHLSAARPHADTLRQLGCRTLGEVRALPREGVSRRFGAGLLAALDRAYGLQTEPQRWITLPERFERRLECPSAIEHAQAMLFGAQRLLAALSTWLAARQSGVLAFTLHWEHDRLRRSELSGGQLALRTAHATRDMAHLARLLAEHLARVTLAAPVLALRLRADEVASLPTASLSLLPDARQAGEGWGQLLERLSARLGPERVLQGRLCADHRPEAMARWVPATGPRPPPEAPPPATLAWQPPWLLREPLRLAVVRDQPVYHGALRLLAGPQRIETGWWVDETSDAPTVQRDYHVALSPQAGLVWIFLLHGPQPAWYLHGIYG